MIMRAGNKCPLCYSCRIMEFYQDQNRRYFQCDTCALIFVDPDSLPTPEEEKERYDQHNNSPEDLEYRKFLGRLAEPLAEHLGSAPQQGLDFGSGPGPTLSVMLEEMGYTMSIHDPFFAPERSVLNRQYDFVTCTEAIEHFHRPGREWQMLINLVRSGGWLAIMTSLAPDIEDFRSWHYKEDPTHVGFFSKKTFRYLATRDGLKCEFVGDDLILLRKNEKE